MALNVKVVHEWVSKQEQCLFVYKDTLDLQVLFAELPQTFYSHCFCFVSTCTQMVFQIVPKNFDEIQKHAFLTKMQKHIYQNPLAL